MVNYKNYKDTIKCLDSLKKVMYQNLSIIVVDNNSKDDSFEILKEYEDDRIIVMESGFNGGFAFGNNFANEIGIHPVPVPKSIIEIS